MKGVQTVRVHWRVLKVLVIRFGSFTNFVNQAIRNEGIDPDPKREEVRPQKKRFSDRSGEQ